MTFTGTIDADHKVIIPDEVLETLNLEPGKPVQLDARVPAAAKSFEFDEQKFDAAIEKYSGLLREDFLGRGYATVDDYMNEIRPKW